MTNKGQHADRRSRSRRGQRHRQNGGRASSSVAVPPSPRPRERQLRVGQLDLLELAARHHPGSASRNQAFRRSTRDDHQRGHAQVSFQLTSKPTRRSGSKLCKRGGGSVGLRRRSELLGFIGSRRMRRYRVLHGHRELVGSSGASSPPRRQISRPTTRRRSPQPSSPQRSWLLQRNLLSPGRVAAQATSFRTGVTSSARVAERARSREPLPRRSPMTGDPPGARSLHRTSCSKPAASSGRRRSMPCPSTRQMDEAAGDPPLEPAAPVQVPPPVHRRHLNETPRLDPPRDRR